MDYAMATQCARLAQDIYHEFKDTGSNETFAGIPGAEQKLIDQQDTDTQLAILYQPEEKLATIVFRGSEQKLADWGTNFKFKLKDRTSLKVLANQQQKSEEQIRQAVQAELQAVDHPDEDDDSEEKDKEKKKSSLRIHQGFSTAYVSVRPQIREYLNSKDITKIIVTGHSLGGALATLCGFDLQRLFSDKAPVTVYTFGSPRVGNGAFIRAYNRRVPNTFRFVFGKDMVPGVPKWWMGYRHVSQGLGLGPRFDWNILSRRIEDHMIGNYVGDLKQKQEVES